jgi:HEAT repeat protein
MGSQDALLARLAANALACTGADAVPALLEVLEKGEQALRLEAARALAHIGDERSIPALFKALDEDSALMEYWANEGLERMGVGMVFFKP